MSKRHDYSIQMTEQDGLWSWVLTDNNSKDTWECESPATYEQAREAATACQDYVFGINETADFEPQFGYVVRLRSSDGTNLATSKSVYWTPELAAALPMPLLGESFAENAAGMEAEGLWTVHIAPSTIGLSTRQYNDRSLTFNGKSDYRISQALVKRIALRWSPKSGKGGMHVPASPDSIAPSSLPIESEAGIVLVINKPEVVLDADVKPF